jgi:hypothetical protein
MVQQVLISWSSLAFEHVSRGYGHTVQIRRNEGKATRSQLMQASSHFKRLFRLRVGYQKPETAEF